MKARKKILISLLVFLCGMCTTAIGASFAWLSGATTEVNVEQLSGGVISQYFHCGTGTEEDPFVITKPVHLYNLTELYTLEDTFADEGYYFQLGYDLDESGDLKFYNYNDSGVQQDGYSESLNMNYYENFRPIGSESNPFNGTFDGSNLTIDKLNISGNGVSDIGVFGYITENASIQDLYLDNITIDVTGAVTDQHDEHDNAYVGYIVGHLQNANCITNSYVNNCEITGSSCLTKNDWGYYGYCENAKPLEDFVERQSGGEDPSWGGSVNMKKMYDRLYDIAGNYTTANNNYAFEKDIVTKYDNSGTFERDALTGYAYTYRDREDGSFVFTRYNNSGPLSNYMYLNGGTRYHQYRQTSGTRSGFYISYNGHYLGVSDGQFVDAQQGWQYTNNHLSILIDGITYYVTHDLTLSTTVQDEWTRQGNSRLYYATGGIFGFGQTYHYITYDNGWTIKTTQTRNNASQLTWTNTTITYITGETSSGADYMDYAGTNVTYFPLITEEDSYAVTGKNTGYVIGGSEDNTTQAYPDKTGDIRVSKYGTSDISNSYSAGDLTTVYTISSNMQTVEIDPTEYEKYIDSKAGFLESIDGSNIYGLHFMPANINQNHLVSAEYTLINGEEKTNYQMPASSIDFNLMEKGYINFFAGTYFSGNNSFFSLHHIERDSNDEITAIKEIAEIYASENTRKDYIYKYSDNTYSETLTSDYSLVFSTNRIKRQNSITNNAVYYFEIPVNDGEYALGSVNGGTGCYLMYLDIGTNGGTDFYGDVDSFGSVEYRSFPNTAETSILLITYEQQSTQALTISVVYVESEKRYNITYSGTATKLLVTQLNAEYNVYVNGSMLTQEIKTHTII